LNKKPEVKRGEKRRVTLRIKAGLFLTALLLAQSANAAIIQLAATIDGAQANAGSGTGSAGTGTASMTLDTETNLFNWNVSWSGLTGTATAAHFHGPAAPGVNGGVQLGIGVDDNPAVGSATISDTQKADLVAGLWYVNVHSNTSPGGEIRGQVSVVPLPAAAWLFGSALLGLGVIRRRAA
jgi:hypothetical protein